MKKLRPNETPDSSDDTVSDSSLNTVATDYNVLTQVESLREPENAFPDIFVDMWTDADEDTHRLCFKEVDGSGQVVAKLVKLRPEELAGQG